MEILIGFMILGLHEKGKKNLCHINSVPGTESYSQRYSTAD